jgi:Uma2 family endonuclease
MGRHVIDTVADELPRLRMSYEEFLDWSGDTTHAEWVDGEVIVFMPPLELHQLVAGFLYSLLQRFVGLFDLGVVLHAPFEMKLFDGSSREPDLLFIAREHFDRRTPERLNGPADLAMEVLSESTARYDRRDKFIAYQGAGLPESWMVDPRPRYRRVEAFALSGAGLYEPIHPDREGRIWSTVLPGFWLNPAWLWQVPLPDPDTAMLQISPVAYRAHLRRLLASDASGGEVAGNGSPAQR